MGLSRENEARGRVQEQCQKLEVKCKEAHGKQERTLLALVTTNEQLEAEKMSREEAEKNASILASKIEAVESQLENLSSEQQSTQIAETEALISRVSELECQLASMQQSAQQAAEAGVTMEKNKADQAESKALAALAKVGLLEGELEDSKSVHSI